MHGIHAAVVKIKQYTDRNRNSLQPSKIKQEQPKEYMVGQQLLKIAGAPSLKDRKIELPVSSGDPRPASFSEDRKHAWQPIVVSAAGAEDHKAAPEHKGRGSFSGAAPLGDQSGVAKSQRGESFLRRAIDLESKGCSDEHDLSSRRARAVVYKRLLEEHCQKIFVAIRDKGTVWHCGNSQDQLQHSRGAEIGERIKRLNLTAVLNGVVRNAETIAGIPRAELGAAVEALFSLSPRRSELEFLIKEAGFKSFPRLAVAREMAKKYFRAPSVIGMDKREVALARKVLNEAKALEASGKSPSERLEKMWLATSSRLCTDIAKHAQEILQDLINGMLAILADLPTVDSKQIEQLRRFLAYLAMDMRSMTRQQLLDIRNVVAPLTFEQIFEGLEKNEMVLILEAEHVANAVDGWLKIVSGRDSFRFIRAALEFQKSPSLLMADTLLRKYATAPKDSGIDAARWNSWRVAAYEALQGVGAPSKVDGRFKECPDDLFVEARGMVQAALQASSNDKLGVFQQTIISMAEEEIQYRKLAPEFVYRGFGAKLQQKADDKREASVAVSFEIPGGVEPARGAVWYEVIKDDAISLTTIKPDSRETLFAQVTLRELAERAALSDSDAQQIGVELGPVGVLHVFRQAMDRGPDVEWACQLAVSLTHKLDEDTRRVRNLSQEDLAKLEILQARTRDLADTVNDVLGFLLRIVPKSGQGLSPESPLFEFLLKLARSDCGPRDEILAALTADVVCLRAIMAMAAGGKKPAIELLKLLSAGDVQRMQTIKTIGQDIPHLDLYLGFSQLQAWMPKRRFELNMQYFPRSAGRVD